MSRRTLSLVLGLIGLALAVSALVIRWNWMFSSPYPVSTDAFYYLHQIRSWAEYGRGYYGSWSPFFPVVGAIAAITQTPPSQTYYFTIVGMLLLTGGSIGALARVPPLLIPWVVALISASDIFFFQIYAFPRQWAALGLVALSVALLLRTQSAQPRPDYFVYSLIAATLGAWCHAFAGIIAAIILLIVFMSEGQKRTSILIVSVSALLSAVMYLVFQQKEFLATAFSLQDWGFARACSLISCSPFEHFEFYYWFTCCVFIVVWAIAQQRAALTRTATALLIAALGLVIGLNLPLWTTEGQMAQRLAYASTWTSLVGIAVAAHFVTPTSRMARSAVFAALFIFALANIRLERKAPVPRGPNSEIIRDHADTIRRWIPHDAILQAPHGVQYQLSYLLDRPATNRSLERIAARAVFRATQTVPRRSPCVEIQQLTESNSNGVSCIILSPGWYIVKGR